jgi:hypothetical protein
MHKFRVMVALLLSLLATSAFATTWAPSEVDDPIGKGKKCDVSEPMSSGSYIYSWPEKYDQVFWPLTDENGIWYCKGSGFTAFIGDFENITGDEKAAISQYLKDHRKKGKIGIESKLALLEGIYALRRIDEEFKSKLPRIFARWYQNLGQIDKANEYRKKSLADIKEKLATELPEALKLEYLYVAANYSRLFGDVAGSDQYLARLKAAAAELKDKELEGYAGYLLELAGETGHIKPGGILDPVSGAASPHAHAH